MNINLVTPTHYGPQVGEAVRQARVQGLKVPVVWNTSGYETEGAIQANEGVVDVYLTDFKYMDPELASRLSGAPDYPEVALRALQQMVEQVGEPVFDDVRGCQRLKRGVLVRHLVLPGHERDSCTVLDVLRRHFGDAVLLSLMSQYTPQIPARDPILQDFPELARRVRGEEYEVVLDHADSLGYEDYFWQEGDSAQESFIPEFAVMESSDEARERTL